MRRPSQASLQRALRVAQGRLLIVRGQRDALSVQFALAVQLHDEIAAEIRDIEAALEDLDEEEEA